MEKGAGSGWGVGGGGVGEGSWGAGDELSQSHRLNGLNKTVFVHRTHKLKNNRHSKHKINIYAYLSAADK